MEDNIICVNEINIRSKTNTGCRIMRTQFSYSGGRGPCYYEAEHIKSEYERLTKEGKIKEFVLELFNPSATNKVCWFINNKKLCPLYKQIPNIFYLNGKEVFGDKPYLQGGPLALSSDIMIVDGDTNFKELFTIKKVTVKTKWIEYELEELHSGY